MELPQHYRRSVTVLVMVLVLALGSFFRFAGNEQKLFWYDEIASTMWYSGQDLRGLGDVLPDGVYKPRDLDQVTGLQADSGLRPIVESVIRDDPQHGPLYFIAMNLWAKAAGDSLGDLRDLSALAGLLLLPFLFWLCLQLTGSRRIAWIAVALAVVSPFHIVYAQEIRQYTFWLMLVTAASATLLWALRAPGTGKWLLYGFLVAAGSYSHLLFCFVIAAHAVFVLGLLVLKPVDGPSVSRLNLPGYVLSTLVAVILFSPWLWVIFTHLSTAVTHLSWSEVDVGFVHLAGMWAFNYSAVFLDTGQVLKFIEDPGWADYAILAVRGLALVPAVIAVMFLLRKPHGQAGIFLLPLILVPFLGLAIPDLLFGGMRSGGGNRFLAPSYLGLEIALAIWLGTGLDKSRARQLLFGFYLVAGLFSSVVFYQSGTWWNKTIGHFNLEVASRVNQVENALLLTRSRTDLLSIGHALDDGVSVQLKTDGSVSGIAAGYDTVFYLDPTREFLSEMERRPGPKPVQVHEPSGLYRQEIP